MKLLSLPEEMLSNVFKYTDFASIIRLRRLNQHAERIIEKYGYSKPNVAAVRFNHCHQGIFQENSVNLSVLAQMPKAYYISAGQGKFHSDCKYLTDYNKEFGKFHYRRMASMRLKKREDMSFAPYLNKINQVKEIYFGYFVVDDAFIDLIIEQTKGKIKTSDIGYPSLLMSHKQKPDGETPSATICFINCCLERVTVDGFRKLKAFPMAHISDCRVTYSIFEEKLLLECLRFIKFGSNSLSNQNFETNLTDATLDYLEEKKIDIFCIPNCETKLTFVRIKEFILNCLKEKKCFYYNLGIVPGVGLWRRADFLKQIEDSGFTTVESQEGNRGRKLLVSGDSLVNQ